MKIIYSGLAAFTIMLIFTLVACEKDDDSNKTPEPVVNGEIEAPDPKDYDYYIGMSYNSGNSIYSDNKSFYVIISRNNTEMDFENIELEIQGTEIPLEYANYFDEDFFIANFKLDYADNYTFKFTENGNTTDINIEVIKELKMSLPSRINENEDVLLIKTDIQGNRL